MAISEYFLAPLGLAALASIVPLLLLYFLRPEPTQFAIPTVRFLADEDEEESSNVVLETLRRNPLLFVQLLVLVLVSLALAAPYVSVAEQSTIDETVVVVDASASMATESGGATRFDRAVAAATDAVTGTTSIVVAGGTAGVALRRGPSAEATRTLDALRVSHTEGDLGTAISQATAIAGEEARILVFSDFADATGWRSAVETARVRGYLVELRQFDGGSNAAGVVGYSFDGEDVTVSVRSFADRPIERTVRLGDQSRTVSLAPGDVATETFTVPENGGDLTVGPGDGFPVDDTVPIAAPADPTVEVLVLTNGGNRFLTTALSLVEAVDLTVKEPPTTITETYDVVVFTDVAPQRVLGGNLEAARETIRRGGGVVVQSQPDVAAVGYGDLLLINPSGTTNGSSVTAVDDPLTRNVVFSPPEQYVRGTLREGRPLVSVDGSPLIAVASRGTGRLMYYGYIEDASGFKYNYRYPVFWKRTVFYLAGRSSLAELNRQTGTQLSLPNATVVETPTGTRQGTAVVFDRVGRYTIDGEVFAAGLASESESNVTAPPIERGGGGVAAGRTEERLVPREVTPIVVLAGIGFVLVELLVLRRRGDL